LSPSSTWFSSSVFSFSLLMFKTNWEIPSSWSPNVCPYHVVDGLTCLF
jgi:hypothetical protein